MAGLADWENSQLSIRSHEDSRRSDAGDGTDRPSVAATVRMRAVNEAATEAHAMAFPLIEEAERVRRDLSLAASAFNVKHLRAVSGGVIDGDEGGSRSIHQNASMLTLNLQNNLAVRNDMAALSLAKAQEGGVRRPSDSYLGVGPSLRCPAYLPGRPAIHHCLPYAMFRLFDPEQSSLALQRKARPKILIADPNLLHLITCKIIFDKYFDVVDICSTGKQVLEALQSKTYEAIFLAAEMGEMCAAETTETIRIVEDSCGIESKAFVVGMMSLEQAGDQDLMDRCCISGMDRYILKPLVHHVRMIQQALSTSSVTEGFRRAVLERRWFSNRVDLMALLGDDTVASAAVVRQTNLSNEPDLVAESRVTALIDEPEERSFVEGLLARQRHEELQKMNAVILDMEDIIDDLQHKVELLTAENEDLRQVNHEAVIIDMQARIDALEQELDASRAESNKQKEKASRLDRDIRQLVESGSKNELHVKAAVTHALKHRRALERRENTVMELLDVSSKRCWYNYYGSIDNRALEPLSVSLPRYATDVSASWFREQLNKLMVDMHKKSAEILATTVTARRDVLASLPSAAATTGEAARKSSVPPPSHRSGSLFAPSPSFAQAGDSASSSVAAGTGTATGTGGGGGGGGGGSTAQGQGNEKPPHEYVLQHVVDANEKSLLALQAAVEGCVADMLIREHRLWELVEKDDPIGLRAELAFIKDFMQQQRSSKVNLSIETQTEPFSWDTDVVDTLSLQRHMQAGHNVFASSENIMQKASATVRGMYVSGGNEIVVKDVQQLLKTQRQRRHQAAKDDAKRRKKKTGGGPAAAAAANSKGRSSDGGFRARHRTMSIVEGKPRLSLTEEAVFSETDASMPSDWSDEFVDSPTLDGDGEHPHPPAERDTGDDMPPSIRFSGIDVSEFPKIPYEMLDTSSCDEEELAAAEDDLRATGHWGDGSDDDEASYVSGGGGGGSGEQSMASSTMGSGIGLMASPAVEMGSRSTNSASHPLANDDPLKRDATATFLTGTEHHTTSSSTPSTSALPVGRTSSISSNASAGSSGSGKRSEKSQMKKFQRDQLKLEREKKKKEAIRRAAWLARRQQRLLMLQKSELLQDLTKVLLPLSLTEKYVDRHHRYKCFLHVFDRVSKYEHMNAVKLEAATSALYEAAELALSFIKQLSIPESILGHLRQQIDVKRKQLFSIIRDDPNSTPAGQGAASGGTKTLATTSQSAVALRSPSVTANNTIAINGQLTILSPQTSVWLRKQQDDLVMQLILLQEQRNLKRVQQQQQQATGAAVKGGTGTTGAKARNYAPSSSASTIDDATSVDEVLALFVERLESMIQLKSRKKVLLFDQGLHSKHRLSKGGFEDDDSDDDDSEEDDDPDDGDAGVSLMGGATHQHQHRGKTSAVVGIRLLSAEVDSMFSTLMNVADNIVPILRVALEKASIIASAAPEDIAADVSRITAAAPHSSEDANGLSMRSDSLFGSVLAPSSSSERGGGGGGGIGKGKQLTTTTATIGQSAKNHTVGGGGGGKGAVTAGALLANIISNANVRLGLKGTTSAILAAVTLKKKRASIAAAARFSMSIGKQQQQQLGKGTDESGGGAVGERVQHDSKNSGGAGNRAAAAQRNFRDRVKRVLAQSRSNVNSQKKNFTRGAFDDGDDDDGDQDDSQDRREASEARLRRVQERRQKAGDPYGSIFAERRLLEGRIAQLLGGDPIELLDHVIAASPPSANGGGGSPHTSHDSQSPLIPQSSSAEETFHALLRSVGEDFDTSATAKDELQRDKASTSVAGSSASATTPLSGGRLQLSRAAVVLRIVRLLEERAAKESTSFSQYALLRSIAAMLRSAVHQRQEQQEKEPMTEEKNGQKVAPPPNVLVPMQELLDVRSRLRAEATKETATAAITNSSDLPPAAAGAWLTQAFIAKAFCTNAQNVRVCAVQHQKTPKTPTNAATLPLSDAKGPQEELAVDASEDLELVAARRLEAAQKAVTTITASEVNGPVASTLSSPNAWTLQSPTAVGGFASRTTSGGLGGMSGGLSPAPHAFLLPGEKGPSPAAALAAPAPATIAKVAPEESIVIQIQVNQKMIAALLNKSRDFNAAQLLSGLPSASDSSRTSIVSVSDSSAQHPQQRPRADSSTTKKRVSIVINPSGGDPSPTEDGSPVATDDANTSSSADANRRTSGATTTTATTSIVKRSITQGPPVSFAQSDGGGGVSQSRRSFTQSTAVSRFLEDEDVADAMLSEVQSIFGRIIAKAKEKQTIANRGGGSGGVQGTEDAHLAADGAANNNGDGASFSMPAIHRNLIHSVLGAQHDILGSHEKEAEVERNEARLAALSLAPNNTLLDLDGFAVPADDEDGEHTNGSEGNASTGNLQLTARRFLDQQIAQQGIVHPGLDGLPAVTTKPGGGGGGAKPSKFGKRKTDDASSSAAVSLEKTLYYKQMLADGSYTLLHVVIPPISGSSAGVADAGVTTSGGGVKRGAMRVTKARRCKDRGTCTVSDAEAALTGMQVGNVAGYEALDLVTKAMNQRRRTLLNQRFRVDTSSFFTRWNVKRSDILKQFAKVAAVAAASHQSVATTSSTASTTEGGSGDANRRSNVPVPVSDDEVSLHAAEALRWAHARLQALDERQMLDTPLPADVRQWFMQSPIVHTFAQGETVEEIANMYGLPWAGAIAPTLRVVGDSGSLTSLPAGRPSTGLPSKGIMRDDKAEESRDALSVIHAHLFSTSLDAAATAGGQEIKLRIHMDDLTAGADSAKHQSPLYPNLFHEDDDDSLMESNAEKGVDAGHGPAGSTSAKHLANPHTAKKPKGSLSKGKKGGKSPAAAALSSTLSSLTPQQQQLFLSLGQQATAPTTPNTLHLDDAKSAKPRAPMYGDEMCISVGLPELLATIRFCTRNNAKDTIAAITGSPFPAAQLVYPASTEVDDLLLEIRKLWRWLMGLGQLALEPPSHRLTAMQSKQVHMASYAATTAAANTDMIEYDGDMPAIQVPSTGHGRGGNGGKASKRAQFYTPFGGIRPATPPPAPAPAVPSGPTASTSVTPTATPQSAALLDSTATANDEASGDIALSIQATPLATPQSQGLPSEATPTAKKGGAKKVKAPQPTHEYISIPPQSIIVHELTWQELKQFSISAGNINTTSNNTPLPPMTAKKNLALYIAQQYPGVTAASIVHFNTSGRNPFHAYRDVLVAPAQAASSGAGDTPLTGSPRTAVPHQAINNAAVTMPPISSAAFLAPYYTSAEYIDSRKEGLSSAIFSSKIAEGDYNNNGSSTGISYGSDGKMSFLQAALGAHDNDAESTGIFIRVPVQNREEFMARVLWQAEVIRHKHELFLQRSVLEKRPMTADALGWVGKAVRTALGQCRGLLAGFSAAQKIFYHDSGFGGLLGGLQYSYYYHPVSAADATSGLQGFAMTKRALRQLRKKHRFGGAWLGLETIHFESDDAFLAALESDESAGESSSSCDSYSSDSEGHAHSHRRRHRRRSEGAEHHHVNPKRSSQDADADGTLLVPSSRKQSFQNVSSRVAQLWRRESDQAASLFPHRASSSGRESAGGPAGDVPKGSIVDRAKASIEEHMKRLQTVRKRGTHVAVPRAPAIYRVSEDESATKPVTPDPTPMIQRGGPRQHRLAPARAHWASSTGAAAAPAKRPFAAGSNSNPPAVVTPHPPPHRAPANEISKLLEAPSRNPRHALQQMGQERSLTPTSASGSPHARRPEMRGHAGTATSERDSAPHFPPGALAAALPRVQLARQHILGGPKTVATVPATSLGAFDITVSSSQGRSAAPTSAVVSASGSPHARPHHAGHLAQAAKRLSIPGSFAGQAGFVELSSTATITGTSLGGSSIAVGYSSRRPSELPQPSISDATTTSSVVDAGSPIHGDSTGGSRSATTVLLRSSSSFHGKIIPVLPTSGTNESTEGPLGAGLGAGRGGNPLMSSSSISPNLHSLSDGSMSPGAGGLSGGAKGLQGLTPQISHLGPIEGTSKGHEGEPDAASREVPLRERRRRSSSTSGHKDGGSLRRSSSLSHQSVQPHLAPLTAIASVPSQPPDALLEIAGSTFAGSPKQLLKHRDSASAMQSAGAQTRARTSVDDEVSRLTGGKGLLLVTSAHTFHESQTTKLGPQPMAGPGTTPGTGSSTTSTPHHAATSHNATTPLAVGGGSITTRPDPAAQTMPMKTTLSFTALLEKDLPSYTTPALTTKRVGAPPPVLPQARTTGTEPSHSGEPTTTTPTDAGEGMNGSQIRSPVLSGAGPGPATHGGHLYTGHASLSTERHDNRGPFDPTQLVIIGGVSLRRRPSDIAHRGGGRGAGGQRSGGLTGGGGGEFGGPPTGVVATRRTVEIRGGGVGGASGQRRPFFGANRQASSQPDAEPRK